MGKSTISMAIYAIVFCLFTRPGAQFRTGFIPGYPRILSIERSLKWSGTWYSSPILYPKGIEMEGFMGFDPLKHVIKTDEPSVVW